MSDRLLKESDVLKIAFQLPLVVNSAFADAVKALPSADRPQGEWIDKDENLWKCSNCGMVIYSESEQDRNEFHKWCGRCGCAMKGADDE